MEIQIKKAIKAGNSSAVILPRSWLNEKVRVELLRKTPDVILYDVIDIIKNYIDLKDVVGIYLTGSYARGEEDETSDLDILVITNDLDKEMISKGICNILIVSEELLRQKIEKDLFPIGQMIREARPLLNSSYLKNIDVRVTKRNVKWYLDTTEDKLKIIKEVIERSKKSGYLSDLVAYTLVLRIKTLHIIGGLVRKRDYSKRDFVELIKRISKGASAYERYLSVKNNMGDKKGIKVEEAERLYDYLEKQLKEVKEIIRRLH